MWIYVIKIFRFV